MSQFIIRNLSVPIYIICHLSIYYLSIIYLSSINFDQSLFLSIYLSTYLLIYPPTYYLPIYLFALILWRILIWLYFPENWGQMVYFLSQYTKAYLSIFLQNEVSYQRNKEFFFFPQRQVCGKMMTLKKSKFHHCLKLL